MTISIERAQRILEQRKRVIERYAKSPRGRKLASIRQMIYQAKKRGDVARVAELEKRKQRILNGEEDIINEN